MSTARERRNIPAVSPGRLGDERTLVVVDVPSPNAYVRFVKPVIDVVLGTLATLATLPLIVLAATAVWVSTGERPLYTQPRVGRGGRVFTIFKLKTMIDDRRCGDRRHGDRRARSRSDSWDRRECDRRQVHKSANDPRVTAVGRFLRTWSIDELPQFWNVVRGDMSLIGPRPELVDIVETKYQPWQHQRHLVKPGVTGPWQIADRSLDAPMYERTDIDIDYVRTVSLRTDVELLVKTVPAVLGLSKGH